MLREGESAGLGDLVGHAKVVLLKDADVDEVERSDLVVGRGGGGG